MLLLLHCPGKVDLTLVVNWFYFHKLNNFIDRMNVFYQSPPGSPKSFPAEKTVSRGQSRPQLFKKTNKKSSDQDVPPWRGPDPHPSDIKRRVSSDGHVGGCRCRNWALLRYWSSTMSVLGKSCLTYFYNLRNGPKKIDWPWIEWVSGQNKFTSTQFAP